VVRTLLSALPPAPAPTPYSRIIPPYSPTPAWVHRALRWELVVWSLIAFRRSVQKLVVMAAGARPGRALQAVVAAVPAGPLG
jgi:hypothetical protein